MNTIYTVGHSNITIDEFLELLSGLSIKALADVRGFPGSRKFPWFNKENLGISLPSAGIEYIHIKELGGRRKVKPDSKNTGWRNPQFRGYADHMESEEFLAGIKILTELALRTRTALMCSEILWWRCHRSMISDYLKVHGWEVLHIMGKEKIKEHTFTQPAKIINGELSYS